MDLGLLLIRLVIGLLFVGHGAQKLFGWFGGYGLKGTAGWLESMNMKPAILMALMAGLSEFIGGLLFVLRATYTTSRIIDCGNDGDGYC